MPQSSVDKVPTVEPTSVQPRVPSAETASRPRRRWRRGFVGLTTFTTIYLLVLVYPPIRIATLVLEDWSPGPLAVFAIIVLPLLGRTVHDYWPGLVTRRIATIATTWLGICFVGLAVLVPFEITHLVLTLVGSSAMLTDTAAAWVPLILVVGLSAYALFNALHARVKNVRIDTRGRVKPTRLAQISDSHLGSREPEYFRRVIRRIKDLAPDYLLITGDLIDSTSVVHHLDCLAQLDCPIYYVTGNHERYAGLDPILAKLDALGVQLMRNRTHVQDDIQFIGIDDAEPHDTVRRRIANLDVDPHRFSILLYHRPDGFEDAAAAGVDLMLCGHTHNGQIVPFNLLVRRMYPRIKGLYRHGDAHLHVSTGTGTWGPVMRLGSYCEITLVHLS
jgi:predicted MPP superfamily phosphohydrolase